MDNNLPGEGQMWREGHKERWEVLRKGICWTECIATCRGSSWNGQGQAEGMK